MRALDAGQYRQLRRYPAVLAVTFCRYFAKRVALAAAAVCGRLGLPISFPRRPIWVKVERVGFAGARLRGLMHLRWSLAPSLLVAAALIVPALAQQQPADTGTPAAAPRKPHKPRPEGTAKPAAAAVAAPAAAGGAKPTLLSQYGEWGAYTASPGGKKVCFAIAKPSASETIPADRPRNPSYMFISSRPADKVSNEVSIIIGYPFKPNTEATAEVGTTTFALSTQQDGAWVKNGTEEAHMVEAMRAGQSAIVKGMSAKGTRSTDTFSLRGLAQALDRVDQECK